jgi:hypothetical protein
LWPGLTLRSVASAKSPPPPLTGATGGKCTRRMRRNSPAAVVKGQLVQPACFAMDSAVLGLASSGCDCCKVRVFRQRFTLEDATGFHAFAPLEALTCMCMTIGMPLRLSTFLTGSHCKFRPNTEGVDYTFDGRGAKIDTTTRLLYSGQFPWVFALPCLPCKHLLSTVSGM